ncbi:hypothetical protein JW979_10990 [bacterium]|nr:hypothetical protein [candidate division CSSED10-310 bacterium]
MKISVISVFLLIFTGMCFGAVPDRVLYQGQLKDSEGVPVPDGDYDVTLTLYSSETGGDQIMIDSHLAADGQAVPVSGGLYFVFLGGGTVSDGSGPGNFMSLSEVFSTYQDIWVEVQMDGQTIEPMLPVARRAYALKSDLLDGRDSTEFGDGNSLDADDGSPVDAVVIDDDGRVGIGTSTPADTLHIRDTNTDGMLLDTPSGSYGHFLFAHDGAAVWGFNHYPDDSFRVVQSGVDCRMTLLPGGNVGFGTNTPANILDVSGDLHVSGALRDSGGESGSPDDLLQSTGSGIAWTKPADLWDSDWTVSGDNMWSNCAGNVGMGTSSPASRLTVAGNESDQVGTGSQFLMGSDADVNRAFAMRIGSSGTQNFHLDRYHGGWFSFLTVNRDDGKTGLGTTTPRNKLDISGSAVIGSAYAGSIAAPADGLLVEGTVGIGTISPSNKLNVSGGDIRIDGDQQLKFKQETTADTLNIQCRTGQGIGIKGNRLYHSADVTHSWQDMDAVNERMMLTVGTSGGLQVFGTGANYFAGRLGIGTVPDNKLEVAGGVVVGAGMAGDNPAPANGLLVKGNVGIGTSTVNKRLVINGGSIAINNASDVTKTIFHLSDSDTGVFKFYGPNDYLNALLGQSSGNSACGAVKTHDVDSHNRTSLFASPGGNGYLSITGANGNRNAVCNNLSGYPNNGWVGILSPNESSTAKMYIDDTGYGMFYADYYSFRTPHPEKTGQDIWYSSIGAPEAAVYTRGSAKLDNGEAEILLPDHFKIVADNGSMTVYVTPLSPDSQGLAVVYKSLEKIVIQELHNGTGSYAFDWEVYCERRGSIHKQIIQPGDRDQCQDLNIIEGGQSTPDIAQRKGGIQ